VSAEAGALQLVLPAAQELCAVGEDLIPEVVAGRFHEPARALVANAFGVSER